MREKASPLGYYTIGIAALFLLGFLLLIIFGAQVFEDAVAGQDQNDQTRALRSYLVTCSRSAGAEDVTVKDGGSGIDSQILMIRDSGTDYGLQVYLSDGQLVENYGRMDAAPDPSSAQPIAETSVFTVERISDETISVTTDAGRTLLHTRDFGAAASANAADAANAGDGANAADAANAAEGGEPR